MRAGCRGVLVGALMLGCCWCAGTQAVAPATPLEQRRGAENTYLDFPDWYPAHSAAEYAKYISADRPSSDFPYWGQVAQLWGGYGQAFKATLRADFQPLTHAHLLTRASLATASGAIASAYEVTIGRLSELTRTQGPTSEERYAAKVAQDYADFVRTRPWYEFDFGARLQNLWRDTGCNGPDLLRKWERKYALSSVYATKAIFAWFAGKLAGVNPVATPQRTAVVVDRWVDRIAGNWPEMQRVRTFANGGELVLLPRFDAFKTLAIAIARSGANFAEVAGNGPDALILVSVVVPRDWHPDSAGSTTLFEQTVLTLPEQKRVVLTVPVHELAQTLRELDGMQITVEQVYDY